MWRIGIAFLLGHCCVHALPDLPTAWSSFWPSALLLAGMLCAALALRLPWLLALVLGVAWAWGNAAVRLADDLPAALEGVDLQISGHVASLPQVGDQDPQFEFDVISAPDGVPARVRLAWYEGTARPMPGELWQFFVRLKRRNGFANPGGFDYEGYLFRAGIGATGYVREDARNVRLAQASWRYATVRIRAWLSHRIASAVPGSAMLGILQGLAVGNTQAMTADQWRVLAATGTTHLMAISGLHISMLAVLAAALGARIVHWPGAQARGITAIHGQALAGSIAALTYSLLAGLSVPTQRTLIMLCIFFAARWWRRELNVAHALGLALIGVLLLDPFAPLAVGAWLSFGAVAVIVLAVSGRLARDGVLMNFTRVQAAVTIGLTPLLLASFGSLSLLSPVANFLAVPFFTVLIVPLVLAGTALAALWMPFGEVALGTAAQLLERAWPVLEWLARQPLAQWHFPALGVPALLALVYGATLLVLPGIWPLRVTALLLCLPALLSRPERPVVGEFSLSLLDVGQGLAVVIQTRTHTLLYDAGPAFRTGRDTGELVVLPFLRHGGIRQLDMLVVSHGDLDHQGGMHSILHGMPTARVMVGPSVMQPPAGAQACRAGQQWHWDGVTFLVLHPGKRTYERDNDSSCVLRIQGAGGSALLTGDIERAAEAELVAAPLEPVDIVILPHHGSRSSSTQAFVTALHPQYALAPAGYRNRWGFPKPDVIERWQAAGARTFSTIESGAIELHVSAQGVQAPREYRALRRRYWSSIVPPERPVSPAPPRPLRAVGSK